MGMARAVLEVGAFLLRFREEAQRCEELRGHHGVGRAAGAARRQQAADALSAVPTAGFGRSPLLRRVHAMPPTWSALRSLGAGCAAGAVRCREVCPFGVLAKGISVGKRKTGWKVGDAVDVGTGLPSKVPQQQPAFSAGGWILDW